MYSENARIKIKEIARALNLSNQRVKYNIKRLNENGIIYQPYCIFDYSYFGLIIFKVYFKGAYASEAEKEKLIEELKKNQFITAIYDIGGEFDLVIEMESPNPSRFNKEFKKIITQHNRLKNYKIVLNIVSHLFPRNYLIRNKELRNYFPDDIIIGGDRERLVFDDKENKIIENLLNKPIMRMSFLAKKTGINVRTTKKIFTKLQYEKVSKEKVVNGVKYLINNSKIGITRIRLFLKLHNITQESENELIRYTTEVPEILHLNKTVGDWEVEIDIEAFDKRRIREIVMEIKEKFIGIIENFNSIEFNQFYLRQYLPRYLFEHEKNE